MSEHQTVSPFDRALGELVGLNEVTHTAPTTKVTANIVGAQTFIVQTFRRVDVGDTIFLQYVSGDNDKPIRISIPPAVADVIARQREALTTKSRKRGALKAVETRKESGQDVGAALRRPEVRKRALAARKRKAAERKARKARKGGGQ